MRSWILLAALAAGSSQAADDELAQMNAAGKAWDEYARSSSRNQPESASLLSGSALRHVGFLRDAALYASAEQSRRLPIPDRVLVYALRATQDPATLAGLDDLATARLALSEGWYGVAEPDEGESLPELSHVTLISPDHAIGELSPPTGTQYAFGPELFREEGRWKVAPQALTLDEEAHIRAQIQRSGMSEQDMLQTLLQYFLGEEREAPSLAALERPLHDDAAWRARLNERWPNYQATYKARADALGVKSARGDSFAQFVLGTLLVSGSVPAAAAKDEPRGWALLGQASDAGNDKAAWLVFEHLTSTPAGLSEEKMKQSLPHLRRAAAGGNAEAMARLGSLYFEGGGGVERDCRQAADWQARAEEGGVEHARNDQVWTWATCPIADQRDPAKALQLAAYMVERKDQLHAAELDTVAAAYAANRQFENAIDFQRRALDKLAALDVGDDAQQRKAIAATRKRMQSRLRDYQSGRDYVQDYNTFEEVRAGRY